MKRARKTLICFVIFAAFVLVAAGLAFLIPWLGAAREMPAGCELEVFARGGGEYELSWTAAERVGDYRISISQAGEDGAKLREFDVSGTSALLSDLPEGEALSLSITPLGRWRTIGGEFLRPGRRPAVAQLTLEPLEIGQFECRIDDEAQTLELDMGPDEGLSYELRLLDGEVETPVKSGGAKLTVSFGAGGDLPMPEHGEELTFAVRAVRRSDGLTLTGTPSEGISVDRQALLPGRLELDVEDLGGNRYRLSWNETKGEGYELQQRVDGEWRTAASFGLEDAREYRTGLLPSCRDEYFRVISVGGRVEEGAQFAAEPAEAYIRTGLCTTYCTSWPLTELAFYPEPDWNAENAGSIPAGTALCVLAEENGLFKVRYAGEYGYVDSNYCLINLPEYMGDLVNCSITNSYESLYAVHGYEIPEVTGEVVKGYEHVQLGDGSSLAPYLYPCCGKLYDAAIEAICRGYRLKIYDSYRPNEATRDIYDKAEALSYEPVPELDIYGEVPEELPELADGEVLTYLRLWTEGSFGLPNFLAQNGSMHNMGIALDLTLETLSGEELEMQTDMHDLSIYSVIYKNNAEANLLSELMKGAGFGGLTSEWWHFQDNDTRSELKLNIYMYSGVSAEGWTADDIGWRYRRADGSFVTGAAEIGGVSYDFGEDGYCEYRQAE